MRRLLVAAVFAAAASLTGAAQETRTLTLREAADEVLAANPAIAAATAGRAAAAAGLAETRASWLPRVDASGTWMRSDNPVFVFGSLLEQGRFSQRHFDPAFLNDPDPLTNTRLALNLRYTVFDRFQRLHAGERARNAMNQADAGTDEARQRLRAETIARFHGVLLASAKRDVAADAVRTAEAQAAAMRDRAEKGLLVESDVLAAEVQLASFRNRVTEAEGEIAIARAALATVLGRTADAASIDIAGAIPSRELPLPAVSDAVSRALAARGEVRVAASMTANAQLQVKTARASILPRADAFASWGASRGDPDSALGVVLTVDVFDPARRSRVAAGVAGLEGAQAAEKAARNAVTMEVISAWHRTNAAHGRIAVAEKSVENAAAAARIVADRYENGLTTITETLRAQNALVAARLELLAARYEYITGYAELLRSTGDLNDVDLFS